MNVVFGFEMKCTEPRRANPGRGSATESAARVPKASRRLCGEHRALLPGDWRAWRLVGGEVWRSSVSVA